MPSSDSRDLTNSRDLQRRLKKLSKSELTQLLLELHGRHEEVDAFIDLFLLRRSPSALAANLSERIQAIGQSRQFIRYGETFGYAAQLQQLLQDIEASLMEDYPLQACDILAEFIITHEKVFVRSDDSAGAISDVYREAVSTMARAITSARRRQRFPEGYWLSRFAEWRDRDAGNLLLGLLASDKSCFTDSELSQLAWRYERQLRQAVKKGLAPQDDYFREALTGLQGAAQALNDPDLYAQAVKLAYPELSDFLKIELAENYLKASEPDKALACLDTPEADSPDLLKIRLLAYEQLGDRANKRDALQRLFNLEPTPEHLQALLHLAPREEREEIIDDAIQSAEQAGDGALAASLLLELQQPQRALALLQQQGEALQQYYHGDLLALAERFKENRIVLGAILCYRALLEDILNRSYAKAYAYAADYIKELTELDAAGPDYQSTPDHSAFLVALRRTHPDKTGFWSRVDGSVLLRSV
ncbi:conserved hypothetical protein [Hahella chejuensis KCTC 2396]|uniref:Uncharacterized protein n=1 Tax=Hahella chejuensis (strain KCTC 2396) TaxID=349521 RepID=Q2SQG0_HAHCH|nr:DUF6880 family protein [Hahella chejuensis]ABC27114.1 conserved hypothetical protein [Hahella chejuensis KCTC 2396]